MKFSVGTNWDPELAAGLARYEEVEDVYAKLAVDHVGGGRPAYVIPKVDKDQAAAHIQAIHDAGIEFTYLLNAACLGGREFDREWRAEFEKLLDELVEMEVDRVTVAIPYMLEVIRARHPQLKLNVSSFAQVNSVAKAQRFEKLGADEIVLDFQTIQRDFRMMEAMARHTDVKFLALANHTCLYNCPSRTHHANLSSHGSQTGSEDEKPTLDYCVMECLNTKLTSPFEMIRMQWIRPEDLWMYEEIGVDKFKLVDRARGTDWILSVVDAYAQRKTPGDNFLQILNAVGSGPLPFADFQSFLGADAANMELAQTVGTLAVKQFLFLDNRELEGFLAKVKGIDCAYTDCETCGVCAETASRALKINPELPPELADKLPGVKAYLQQYLANLYGGQVYTVVENPEVRSQDN